MAYDLITTVNMNEGIHMLFKYLNSVTNNNFSPLIIGMVYLVMVLGMYYSNKRVNGVSDLPIAFAVGSYVMIGFTVILSMIPYIINSKVVIEVLVLASLSTIWLYFSKKGETQGF